MIRAAAVLAALAAPAGADVFDSPPAADVVILGEVHDNPVHHANQARAVAAIRPSAIVFEMLTPELAARITPENRHDPEELATILEWSARGWPDFSMYHPILAAAPGAAVYGAAVPRGDIRTAMTEGAAAAFGSDATAFGLDRDIDPAQRAVREAGQMAAHCDALPEHMLPGMVEAQRLRDASFASAALRALDETGGRVVVIAGTGHARTDWGIPFHIAFAAPDVTVAAIGQTEGPSSAPFTRTVRTGAVERDDPCAAFRRG